MLLNNKGYHSLFHFMNTLSLSLSLFYCNEKSRIYYWLSVQPHLRVHSKAGNRYMQNILMLTD